MSNIRIKNKNKEKISKIKLDNNPIKFKKLKIKIDKRLSKKFGSRKIRKNKIYSKKYNIIKNCILFNLFKYINLFFIILNEDNFDNFKYSNITLKVKGPGYNDIFSSHVDFKVHLYPDIIYINEELQETVNSTYNLIKNVNVVKLIWNHTVNSTNNLFRKCIDITEIDMTNFDSSEVTDMFAMFHTCSSLTSINLYNFNTSKVVTMGYMFEKCSSLTSIDVSSFDTSKVTYI